MTELTTTRGRIASDYPPPRKNVLLLSCMDLRFIDELAYFIERDNLTNRYDHLIVAGAALGVVQQDHYPCWRKTFFEHLGIALKLHHPTDVYVVEHRDCGAYKEFLGKEFGDSQGEQRRERTLHLKQVLAFRKLLNEWCAQQPPVNGQPVQLKLRCFLMDLRGDVEVLWPTKRSQSSKSK